MNYELLDFGNGRKLERLGTWILDRPAPNAEAPPAHPHLWDSATARYTGDRTTDGSWHPAIDQWKDASTLLSVTPADSLHFNLSLTPLPSGQIGVFPEQFDNWQWIANQARRTQASRVLNLFAYTGGSTLAAAAAGTEVTHVDAAKSMVSRARENAALSGLAGAPIRWIVEDAVKFCQREVRRGNRYDAVILDPPSYGHGPKGESWSIRRDLPALLDLCRQLTEAQPKFVLLTCHTPDVTANQGSDLLSRHLPVHGAAPVQCGELYLESSDHRKLPSGTFARGSA